MKQSTRPNNAKELFSGVRDLVFSVKSKDRVKKLSAIGKASSIHEEMGCEVSGREDDFGSQSPPSSKRFKVPLKFFDDFNGVDHASVPRKLRSAMKKRSHESISSPSSDSKKLNRTNDDVEFSKKSKPDMSSITKDEEEVAETLFALAGMFPDSEATDKSKIGESCEAFPSALPYAFRGSMVSKEQCSSRKASTETLVKAENLSGVTVQRLYEGPDNKRLPPMNPQNIAFSSESGDKTRLCDSLHFGFASELTLDKASKQPREQDVSVPERSPELAQDLSTSLAIQLKQHLINERKKNGLALWPGLSSTALEHIKQPPPSKIPAWMNSDSSRPLLDATSSNDKVSEGTARKTLWKKCAAHVYITCLIHSLQAPERSNFEGPKQETVQTVSATKTGNCLPENNLNKSGNVLQHKKPYQDQQHKQSVDAFSVASGGGGVEANNQTQRYHKSLEPTPQFQAPSLNPYSQLPYTTSQTLYYSSMHQLQLPRCPTNASYQRQPLQNPYQHHLWETQYRPAATFISQHHQQFIKMQEHHIPSAYEQPGARLQLQLLCNERL